VTEITPDNATCVDQKQVIDIVFNLKTQAEVKPGVFREGAQQHSQPNRSSFSKAARQSFNLTSKAKPNMA